MVLSPLKQEDPRLRQTCAPVSKLQLRSREQQLEIDAILDFMYAESGKIFNGEDHRRSIPTTVGLSANQVGIMKQICAVDLSIGRRGYSDVYILVNPKLTWWSKALVERPEGCVNFEHIWGVTQRSRSVRVSALDRSGNQLELKLTGWPAALLQHEIDHLEGRLFIDRLPDPSKAHYVDSEDFSRYHKAKPADWVKLVDVSSQAVSLPPSYHLFAD
jgi:peptide deformylase